MLIVWNQWTRCGLVFYFNEDVGTLVLLSSRLLSLLLYRNYSSTSFEVPVGLPKQAVEILHLFSLDSLLLAPLYTAFDGFVLMIDTLTGRILDTILDGSSTLLLQTILLFASV